MKTCTSCQGRGEVHVSPTHEEIRCRTCHGKGKVPDEQAKAPVLSLVERLKARGVSAYQGGDDALASLLREAAQVLGDGRKEW